MSENIYFPQIARMPKILENRVNFICLPTRSSGRGKRNETGFVDRAGSAVCPML